jgi:hypothetical protein
VPPVEQELPTLPKHLRSYPIFGRVRATRSLVFCVMFCRPLFVTLAIVLPVLRFMVSYIPLWYLQTFDIGANVSDFLMIARNGIIYNQCHSVECKLMPMLDEYSAPCTPMTTRSSSL